MDFITIVITGLGLAMDAFSVSVVSGSVYRDLKFGHAFRIGCFFGGFQALMPLIGSLAGLTVKGYIVDFDHWAAFGLLAVVGGKMIYESFKLKEDKYTADPSSLIILLILAIATSIDALAVGLTLSFIQDEIIRIVLVIGVITFILSFAGVYIGKKFGHFFENRFEAVGGLLLILIGLKILAEHLLA